MFEIGSVRVGGPAVQAALSGYSDRPMRRVARAFGAPFAFNEVVLDALVLIKGKGQRRILDVAPDDHPVGGQLMGSEPEQFGRAARMLIAAGYDTVDINFGCPVNKVLGRCRGGYLLTEPSTALEIVDRVLEASGGSVPVTLKMRRGYDDTLESERAFFEILDGALERGIAAVTVHGRTVRQKYVGPSRWSFVAKVKAHCGDRTVLGSGDLFSARDVVRMLTETGVDGVTVARGCIGYPFVFREVRDLLLGGEPRRPTLEDWSLALSMHATEAVRCYGEAKAAARLRPHAIKYAQFHPEPIRARERFVALKSLEDFWAAFESLQGEPATELVGTPVPH